MGECEDAEEYRFWEELLPDALGLIFRNLPLQEVLTVVPRVCKSWGRVVAGPYCWQEIDIEEWSQQQSKPEQIGRMVELLVGRSGGSCRRISVSGLPCDPLLSFIGEHSRALRALEIPRSEISDSVVETVAPRLSNVTFLDISSCTKIGARALEAFGKHCKSLVGLRRVMHPIDLADKECQHDEAHAIARSMPKLRHLEMGYMLIRTEAVAEILGQCRDLKFLDLRGCWAVDDKLLRERHPGLRVLGPRVEDCYENTYWEECSADTPPPPVLDPSSLRIHIPSSPHHALPSTPHKRPVVMTSSSSSSTPTRPSPSPFTPPRRRKVPAPAVPAGAAAAKHLLRCLHLRLRILLLISLPTLYFLSPTPAIFPRSLLADFLSAAAFSCALLLLLCLSLPRLPFALPLPLPLRRARRSPILWSIGSSPSASATTPTTGHFVQVYSNGDVYEGQFHRGRCTGSGVYYYYMSGRYEGDWVDGKYDGFGVETWARGSRYRGQYRQGLRHGYGVYRFYTGDVYAGEWSNGQSHGYGVHTCEDGSRYIGEFKRGVKHGLGHYHFRNGDTYAGEYFADRMHGFGVYSFANGHRYEGAWHEGRRQGLGMYSFRNGETQAGHWQSGVLDTLSTQNFIPGSPIAVNHSKVLNAVQEARRAAEKAYDIPRVDDKVNRAVAAANKAANAARVAAVKAAQKRIPNNGDDLPLSVV